MNYSYNLKFVLGTEHEISYAGILPWLQEYCKLNHSSQYVYNENPITHEFVSCALLFAALPLLQHSFLATFSIDAGFNVTRKGVKSQFFCMSIGDREHRNIPIAFGFFPSESKQNYKDFLGMTKVDPAMEAATNNENNSFIHDRHLSMTPAVKETMDKCLDRTDIVHIVRNCLTYCPTKDLRPLVKAAFSRTKAQHDFHWAQLDLAVISYIDSGEIPKAAYCTYAALALGVVINGERTSNRVEQEMSRSLKIGVRHEEPLVGLVRMAEQNSRLMGNGRRLAEELQVFNNRIN